MSSLLSNATQRAIRRIVGSDTFEILIEAVVDQVYKLSLALPVGFKVLSITSKTDSGTCTLDVQKVSPLGVETSIAGLSAVAATSTKATAVPTFNGTEVCAQGDGLQVEVSANAAAVNLSITIKASRQNGNGD